MFFEFWIAFLHIASTFVALAMLFSIVIFGISCLFDQIILSKKEK